MNYPFRRTSFTLFNGNYELKWPLCTNIVRCTSSIIHVFMQGIGRLLMRTVFPPQRAYEPYGLVHCSTSITNASFAHAEIRSHSPSSLLCANIHQLTSCHIWLFYMLLTCSIKSEKTKAHCRCVCLSAKSTGQN